MRIAAEGMRIVCEIDIIMLRHYYTLREQVNNYISRFSKNIISHHQKEWTQMKVKLNGLRGDFNTDIRRR